jgi:hypothetical protein
MVIYSYNNCKIKLIYKYIKHLNRKNPCKKINAEKYKMQTCYKLFTRNSSLKYHLEKACKIKKTR